MGAGGAMLALVALLLVDDLRISDASGLDVDDVQRVDRGHRVVDLRRKGGRTARAALPSLVADAVDTYLAHRAGLDLGHDKAAHTGRSPLVGPLFVTRTGARWRPGNAARALTALATRTTVPGRSPGHPARATSTSLPAPPSARAAGSNTQAAASTGNCARRHSSIPSASRAARRPRMRRSRTASWASTQYAPRQ